MAPRGRLLNVKHRVRRAHPMRPVVARSLASLEQANTEQITKYQERRMRALIRVAAHGSRFYSNWFRATGLDPRDIRTLEDLKQLPLLSRNDLGERPDEFRVYPRRLMWPSLSSGTTGRAVTVYRTPGSSLFELATLERQWSWFGIPKDARRVVLRGSGFATSNNGSATMSLPGANQLLVSSYYLSPESAASIAHSIRSFKPDTIEGWPSSISLLASFLREREERLPVRGVITSSEVISPAQRQLMREVFEGPIIDHYGQTERVAMAGNCEHSGYHIFPDYGIVELLPVRNAPDRWEIVGTPLHNWGFPLFRYRTGDEVVRAELEQCGCGRAFALIGAIDGRVEDSFCSVDGRPLPLPSTVLDDLVGVRESQVAQLSPGRFEVRIVPGADYDAIRTAEQLRHNVDNLFGPGQTLTVRELPALARPASGKLRNSVVENGEASTPSVP